MLWLIVSKALDKSMKIPMVEVLFPKLLMILLVSSRNTTQYIY